MLGGMGGGIIGSIIAYLGVQDVNFSKALNDANTKAERTAKTIEKTMNAALLAGSAAFATATLAAVKFESKMALVDTLLGGADRNVKQLSKELLNLAQHSGSSIDVLTKALYDTVSAGIPASKAVNTVAVSAQAAAAGFTDVETAGRAGIATMNAYGMSADSLNKIFDIQFNAVKYGVITYEQMANSIGQVLPPAKTLGVSLEELYGSMAFLTKMGQSADMAATNLGRAFQGLVEQQDKLAKFDISIWDEATGTFLGMDNVIGQLAETMKGMTDQQRLATLEAMTFDIRAGRAINSMVLNYQEYSKTLANVSNSQGAMTDAYQRATNTFEHQAKVFRNIVQVAFIETGQGILGTLTPVLKLLNSFPGTLGTLIKIFSETAIVAGTLVAGFKAYNLVAKVIPHMNVVMATSFGPIGLAITAVAGAVLLIKNAMDKAKDEQKKYFENVAKGVLDLEDLEKAYNELNKTTVDVETAHKKTVEAQKKLNDAINSGSKDVDELKKAYQDAVKEEQDAINLKTKIKEASLKLNEAYKKQGIEIKELGNKYGNLSAEQKKIKHDELINTLSQLQNAYAETANKTTKLITATNQYGVSFTKEMEYSEAQRAEDLAEISKQMDSVRNSIELLEKPSKDLAGAFDEISKMAEGSKKQIKEKISALTELYYESEDNAEISKKLEGEIDRLKAQLKESTTATGGFKDAQELLKNTGIETTKMVQDQIKELEKTLPIIKDDEYAMSQYNERMKELKEKIDPAVRAQEELSSAGIETTLMIEDQIKELEAKIPLIKDDAYATEQLNQKIKDLKDKLDVATPAQKALKDAGIETTDMINKQVAELEALLPTVEDDAYATEQLNQKIKDLKDKLEVATPAQKALKDAGIETTDSIKDQIIQYEKLLPTVEGDAYATEQLKEKIKELRDKLNETGNCIVKYGNQLIDAIGSLGLFGDKTDLVKASFKNFTDAVADPKLDEFGAGIESVGALISGFTGKSDKAGQTLGLLATTLGTVLKGGFDPLSLGISIVTGLFSIFSQKNERVVLTVEQVIENLGSLGEEIEKTGELIESLGDKFESVMIVNAKEQVDRYIEMLRTATGENKKALEEQLAAWQNYLAELTKAFTLREEYDKVLEGIDYVTQYVIDSIADFKTAADTAGLSQMLAEQINSAKDLLLTLDPASAAYETLKSKIEAAVAQMVAMNATVNFMGKEVNAATLELTLLIGRFASMEQGTQAWQVQRDIILIYARAMYEAGTLTEQTIQTLAGYGITLDEISQSQTEFTAAVDDSTTSIGNMQKTADNAVADGITALGRTAKDVTISVSELDDKFKASISTLEKTIEETGRLNEYYAGFDAQNLINQLQNQIILNLQLLSTLPKGSQAYDDLAKTIFKAYLQQIAMGGSTEAILAAASAMGISMADLARIYNGYTSSSEEATKSTEEFGKSVSKTGKTVEAATADGVGSAAGTFDEITESVDNTTESLGFLQIQWDDTIKAITGQYTQFEKDMKEANAIIEELLYFKIDLSTTDMDEQLEAAIGRMYKYLATLDPTSQAYADAEKALAELVTKYEELTGTTYVLQQATEENTQTTNDAVDSFKKINEQTDDANSKIQKLGDSLIDFGKSSSLTIDIDPVKELEQSISNIEDRITDLTAKKNAIDIQLALDIEGIEKEKQGLFDRITELQSQKEQIQLEMSIRLQPYQSDIETLFELNEGLQKYRESLANINEEQNTAVMTTDVMNQGFIDTSEVIPTYDFYELAKSLSEVTGQSVWLSEQWTQMMNEMFGEYDEFSKEMKSASELIEKMLYFKTELDTTDADEQLNAMIFRMQDYLATLDPTSQAYQDAQTALDELIKKYEEMGGVLDEQAAIDFNEQQINDAIDQTGKMMQDIIGEYDTVSIDAEIAEATAKINELDLQIADLIAKAEANKIDIDADISKALEELLLLQGQLDEIQNHTVLNNPLTVVTDVDTAVTALQGLKEDLDALDNKTISVVGSAAAINISVEPLAMHQGGLVRAHAGLLAANEIAAILKAGEYVHPDYHVKKYPERNWEAFRVTGDPMALMGGLPGRGRERRRDRESVVVNLHTQVTEGNRWSNMRVYDDKFYERQLYRSRKLEVSANPF